MVCQRIIRTVSTVQSRERMWKRVRGRWAVMWIASTATMKTTSASHVISGLRSVLSTPSNNLMLISILFFVSYYFSGRYFSWNHPCLGILPGSVSWMMGHYGKTLPQGLSLLKNGQRWDSLMLMSILMGFIECWKRSSVVHFHSHY